MESRRGMNLAKMEIKKVGKGDESRGGLLRGGFLPAIKRDGK
jgi:hypothetical protein